MRFYVLLILYAYTVFFSTIYAQETITTTSGTPSPKVDTVILISEDDTVTIISEDKNPVPVIIRDCHPPCRAGYTCVNGECVSRCNPPCPDGYRCDPKALDCVPLYKSSDQVNGSRCGGNKIEVDGKCLKKRDIYTTGNVIFTITDVFFGMGTAYSAIAPFIAERECRWYDYDEWDGYEYYGYWEEIAILCTAPQTGMFVIAGAINQVPKNMQRDMLEDLGETPAHGLIAASWALYAASIGMATGTIFSNLTEDHETIRTFSVFNCIFLFSSYIVSNITYAVQKDKLTKAVREKVAYHPRKQSVTVVPYYAYLKKKSNLGLMVQF